MTSFHIKQEVMHELHGKGTIIAIDEGGHRMNPVDDNRVLTIRFDNDKKHPIRISLAFFKVTPIKDF